jgi:hypothetical protein
MSLIKFRRVGTFLVAIAAVLFSACSQSLLAAASAQAQSTWSDVDHDPIVSNGQTLDFGAYNTLFRGHIGVVGDRECQQVNIPIGTTDGSASVPDDGCWYPINGSDSSIQRVKRGGYEVVLAGQDIAGYFDSIGSQLFPTPNPNVFLQTVPDSEDPSLYHLYFRTGAALNIVKTDFAWGGPALNYTFANPPSGELKNSSGHPYLVDDNLIYSQINYSANGKWMSIWGGGIVTRVDLTTFETTTAYVEPTEDAQVNYAFTSMSPSGRYMAVSVLGESLRVIDFDECSLVEFEDVTQFCATRYLSADIAKFADSGLGLGQLPNFVSDDLLSYYIEQPDGDYDEYLVRAPNTLETNYIALGDSYASGEGEGNSTFYPETDIQGVNMCHLSTQAYPYWLGQDLKLGSTHSVACSGAKMLNVLGNGVFDDNLKDPDRTNQYSRQVPHSTLDLWLPGYYAQTKFVNDNRPNIITVSIGGNDIGFKDILERCLGTGTCYKSYEDRLELVNEINDQFNDLVETFTSVKKATVEDAHIYVIGYPSIIKSGGDCGLAQTIGLDAQETEFANELVDYIDAVTRLASEKAGVAYVDTENAFKGHRLCEGEATNRAVNGITVGLDTPVPYTGWLFGNVLSNGSFHPDKYGHLLLAFDIKDMTHDFTAPMPRADGSIDGPTADAGLALLQAPKDNRPTYKVVYYTTTGQVVYRGSEITVSFNSSTSSDRLNPFALVRGEMHSDPVDLGTLTTDTNGNFSGTVTIPDSVPPGFHALNFYAMGVDGQMHEITQTVYVAASADDYDGNGVPNAQEPCLIFDVPANQAQSPDYACEVVNNKSNDDSTNTTPLTFAPASTKPVSSLTPQVKSANAFVDTILHSASQSVVKPSSTLRNNAPTITTRKVHSSIWIWLVGVGTCFVILLTFFLRLRYAKKQP